MKLIFKITCKNMISDCKRTLYTLIGVALSVSIICIVCGIGDSVLMNLELFGDDESQKNFGWLYIGFVVISCLMSVITIYTTFSINFQNRIKNIGFLSSIGMSPAQKALLVMSEAAIYAVFGVLIGEIIGFGISYLFFEYGAEIIKNHGQIFEMRFSLCGSSVLLSSLLGIGAVAFAALPPVIRMRKLSVTEIINPSNQINISLKQTLLSKIVERLFGKLGTLAGQNYDNNKIKYHAVSMSLSYGTTFFFAVYCFFMYPIRYFSENGYKWDSWLYLCYPAIALAAVFVLVSLVCSFGCMNQNMEHRRKEFAMYKSMGMLDSDIGKMMKIESAFLSVYSIIFGLIGSVCADALVFALFYVTGTTNIKFYFPITVFFAFALLDIIAGFIFAFYSSAKVRKTNIIDALKNVR